MTTIILKFQHTISVPGNMTQAEAIRLIVSNRGIGEELLVDLIDQAKIESHAAADLTD